MVSQSQSPSRARTRVLLADDNALVAAQLRELLEPAFDVVAVVTSGEALEAAFERLAPEVIIADIAMPGEGGLAAVRHIRARHPGARIVLLSVLDTPPMIRLGLAAGVEGYVVKGDAGDELVPAVAAALAGRQYLSTTGRRNLE